ncbi:putative alcohol dehydrogenase I [Auricularia subglabra TFB-10046 SS5]|nr:putative alcohol dehydrogenase I [Auricularia subglabra TFB-10046 SS5]
MTMLAAVYKPESEHLVVERVAKPVPRDDEVLLRVRACGACHSDIVLLNSRAFYPQSFIMGHEISGEAVEWGASVGDEILKGALYSVNIAEARLPGKYTTALRGSPGLGRDGGYAQYIVVPARSLVRVPEGVSPSQAAVAADAGLTAYRAVFNVAKVSKGDKVVIIGAGGLGNIAVQLARIAGASEVIVTDLRPGALELAREHGADATYLPAELDAQVASGFTANVVIDFVCIPSTITQALSILRPTAGASITANARLCVVGVNTGTLELDLRYLVVFPVQILPTLYGTSEDLAGVLQLLAEGKLRLEIEESPLEKVNDVIHDLHSGKIRSRMVVIPPQDNE